MTQWLSIDTYPFDGTWGLFRGGKLMSATGDIAAQHQPPIVVAMRYGEGFDGWYRSVIVTSTNEYIWYYKPTEWMPLNVLDMLEDHHVTAARVML